MIKLETVREAIRNIDGSGIYCNNPDEHKDSEKHELAPEHRICFEAGDPYSICTVCLICLTEELNKIKKQED